MRDRTEMYKESLETEIKMQEQKIADRKELIAMHLSKIEEYKTSLARISTDEYRTELIEMNEERISAGKITIEEIDRRISSNIKTDETLIKSEEEKIDILNSEIARLEEEKESLKTKLEELDQKTPEITPSTAAKNALESGTTTQTAENAKSVETEELNPEHTNEGVTRDD